MVATFKLIGRVGLLKISSPPVNALGLAVRKGIVDGITQAEKAGAKALVLAGDGVTFPAGADIGEHRPERAREMIASFSRLFRLLDALDLPVVMAVDGAALGGGFELVMMADLLLATERSTFGQPEIRLGFFAPVGVVELPALVGRAKAMEITCSGRVSKKPDNCSNPFSSITGSRGSLGWNSTIGPRSMLRWRRLWKISARRAGEFASRKLGAARSRNTE